MPARVPDTPDTTRMQAASAIRRGGLTRRTLGAREPHHRHRRPAQRREVDALQRPDQERRARRELPVRHDRAQRRRRRRPRPAARGARGKIHGSARLLPATVSFVDIAGIVRGASRGRGAGQQVPREHPRERRDLPGDPRVPRPQRRARRRRGLAEGRHRDDQHRADPRRPADHREGAAAAGEGVAAGQGQEQGRDRDRGGSRRRSCCESGTTLYAGAAVCRHRHGRLPRAAPADGQAVPLRLQRRRGRAGRRGLQGRDARAGRAGRGDLPRRQDRGRAGRAATTTRRSSCCSRWAQRSPGSTSWRTSASGPSGCRPTSPPGRRSRGPGRSRSGATAPQAAGVIHTDFQRGFIKAEVVSYDDLVDAGSMAEAKARGKVRIEGKDYVMADGDVVEFRFNV